MTITFFSKKSYKALLNHASEIDKIAEWLIIKNKGFYLDLIKNFKKPWRIDSSENDIMKPVKSATYFGTVYQI